MTRGVGGYTCGTRRVAGFEEQAQMRNLLVGAGFTSATAALMIALQLGVIPTASGAEAGKAPRTADGKPNMHGIRRAVNTAKWDLQDHAERSGPLVALGAVGAVPAGGSVVEGGETPCLPAAAA